MTSGEGRVSVYGVERTTTGERVYTKEAPDGSIVVRRHTDGSTAITQPNGTETTSTLGPDPRFGMLAPVTTEQRIETPSGLALLQTTLRTAELEDATDQLSHTALTTTVTVNDRALTAAFDAASLTWTQTSPEGRVQTSKLNERGLLDVSRVTGLAEVNYQYDDRGRLTQMSRGATNQRAVEFDYDANGYLGSLTDAQNKTVTFENDIVGRVLQQTFPNGSTVAYDYDPNGNLTEIRLPSGETHRFQYTSVDQQEVYSPPNPDAGSTDAPIGMSHPTTQYQYNRDKQLETITRPDGVVVDYVYNGTTGQLTDLIIPAGTYEYDYYGEFDPIHSGQLKTVISPGGQQTGYDYDGFLLTGTNWSGPISGSLGYEYNNYFEPTNQTVNGVALSLGYNDDSQLTLAGDLSIQYVAENGLLNGTSIGFIDTDYAYNNYGELNSFSADYAGTGLYNYTLHRDDVGRIIGKTETLGASTTEYQYLYDNDDRLDQVIENGASIHSWSYDANGNRTHEDGVLVAQFDAQDRVVSYEDNEYRYTANGELTEKTDTAANETTQYDYDAFSNLRSVTLPDTTHIEYIIDGQNRRVGKLRNGTLEQGFLYQGQLNPIAELDHNNQVIARFVYGDKINVPSYLIKDGVNYRVISDHLGSVRLVVNAQTGAVAQRMDYDAWGNVTNDTNPGFQPFGYAGGIYDRDTGLTRFGARDYDPEIGRWTTKDPIGFAGGLNHYAYASSDPINFIDPTGYRSLGVCEEPRRDKNALQIIWEQLPQWWGSDETADLRVGISLTKDAASIPYKSIAVLTNLESAGLVAIGIRRGNYDDAMIELGNLVAGESTTRFLSEFGFSKNVNNAISTGVSNASDVFLNQDNYSD
jgi:RHS repeat-associated protein